MERTGWIGIGAVLLGAAACDSGPAAAPPTKMEIANPYHDRLLALSVLNRSLGLRRAIQDAGQTCRRITASAYQAPYKGQQMWIGRCADDGDYAVFVGPNGDVQVRNCPDAAGLQLPACRTDQLQTVERIKTL